MESASLPRELVRWLQTLDLPQQIRHPKRDMANGYMAAEICARYWSNVDLRQFDNGTSTKVKASNWSALRKAMSKNNATLPDTLVDDVIAARDDAGRMLLEALYTLFTNRTLQKAVPLDAPELQQIPTYVKAQRYNDQQQQQHQFVQQQQQQLQQMEEEAQLAAAAEREAQEAAERKRQQQKATAAASAKKPKPPMKVQGIKALSEEEETEPQPKLQFSTVTVKPLSGQALARLGVARVSSASRRLPNANASSDAPNRVSAGDGVLNTLSATIEATLRESTAPSWLVPPGTTYVEHFAQQHQRIPGSIKDAIWSALYASIDDTSVWLANRPGDVSAFAATFLPGVSTTAVQTLLGRAHYAFTGLDAANAAAYAKSVFANLAGRRHSYALQALRKSVLPLVVPSLLAKRTHHLVAVASEFTEEDAVTCVDALAALAGCGVDSWAIAETRVRQLITVVHESLMTPTSTADGNPVAAELGLDLDTNGAVAPVDRYMAFLLAIDAICCLPAVVQNRAVDLHSPARSEFEPASARTATTEEDAAMPARAPKMHTGVATAVLYHANAALHHCSPSVRVLGLRLLTRLASEGHITLIVPRFLVRLTDLTQPAAESPLLYESPEYKQQALSLLRASVAAVGQLRLMAAGAGDSQLSDEEVETLAYAEALDNVVLHVTHAPEQPVSFFANCSASDKLVLISELGAASASVSAIATADGHPTPQQLAVRNVVAALMGLPKAVQLGLVSPVQRRSLKLAAEQTRAIGGVAACLASTPSPAGGAHTWPALPVASMLVQLIAASPIVPPVVPVPKGGAAVKAAVTKAPQPGTGPSEPNAIAEALHLSRILYAFTAARNRDAPLCSTALIPLGWEIMRVAWGELSKAIKYAEQYSGMRARLGAVPPPAPPDAAMMEYGRRSRAIVGRFFAEWSGVPSASTLAQPTLDALVWQAPALDDMDRKDLDDAAEGWDRILEWWNATVQPQQPQ